MGLINPSPLVAITTLVAEKFIFESVNTHTDDNWIGKLKIFWGFLISVDAYCH